MANDWAKLTAAIKRLEDERSGAAKAAPVSGAEAAKGEEGIEDLIADLDKEKRVSTYDTPGLDPTYFYPGSACDDAARKIVRMGVLEVRALLTHPLVRKAIEGSLDKERVEAARRDVEVLRASKGKSAYPVRAVKRPFWIRTVDAVIDTKPDGSRALGMEKLVGDWVTEPMNQCDDGDLLIIGLKSPVKRYAIAKASAMRLSPDGKPMLPAEVKLFPGVRKDLLIRGVNVLEEFEEFGLVVDKLREVTGAPAVEEDKPDVLGDLYES